MDLLSKYNEYLAQAEQTKLAEAQANQLTPEQEVIEKYAELADNMLEKEYGTDYAKEDVVKLAEMLIDHDMQEQAEYEKIAELDDAGRIIARSFSDELQKIAQSQN